MWSTQVQVAPAAYHIKFLVDGVWKTSDALPLATDTGGRLVNYIDVRTKGPEIKEWGKDWWGVGTEDEEDQGTHMHESIERAMQLISIFGFSLV
jgi:hypothetical protein